MTKILNIILAAALAFAVYSCKKDSVNNPVGNQAPHTGVFLYPDSTISRQPSKINIHWWGDDPDGFVVGYYFSWDSVHWAFTQSNDSLFALKIGVVDTTYTFHVSAADDGGNGKYDNDIVQNGIDYGPEPFTDKNNNGVWDQGEDFVDIGLIDPNPASLKFPIKNSAPTVEWDKLTVMPDSSFPVMSFGWNASDIDGDETISSINIVLNDTTNAANVVSLNGEVRNVTIVAKDFSSSTASADILINGLESNMAKDKLPGLKLNGQNRLFIQAVDISGAKSKYIAMPDPGKSWYVKKPKGDLLVVDDYVATDNAASFYSAMFDSLGLNNKYDVYDFHSASEKPPDLGFNVTILLTMKLYKYVFWYTDNNPSLDLLSASVQKYIDGNGKIAFSMQFPQNIDLTVLAGFLPINSDSSDARLTVLAGTKVSAKNTQPDYPDLELSSTAYRMKSFYLNPLGGIPIYYFPNKEMKGYVGFTDNQKNLFFIGLPLHKSNGGSANVQNLLRKVFLQDFGLTL